MVRGIRVRLAQSSMFLTSLEKMTSARGRGDCMVAQSDENSLKEKAVKSRVGNVWRKEKGQSLQG